MAVAILQQPVQQPEKSAAHVGMLARNIALKEKVTRTGSAWA